MISRLDKPKVGGLYTDPPTLGSEPGASSLGNWRLVPSALALLSTYSSHPLTPEAPQMALTVTCMWPPWWAPGAGETMWILKCLGPQHLQLRCSGILKFKDSDALQVPSIHRPWYPRTLASVILNPIHPRPRTESRLSSGWRPGK